MNTLVQIKKIVVLVFVLTIVPLCAMDEKNNGRIPKITQKSSSSEEEQLITNELLIYPKDFVLGDVKLPDYVHSFKYTPQVTLYVPKGFDVRLIHPTVIPERYDDFLRVKTD